MDKSFANKCISSLLVASMMVMLPSGICGTANAAQGNDPYATKTSAPASQTVVNTGSLMGIPKSVSLVDSDATDALFSF